MKKFVLLLIATSLFVVGCSDISKQDIGTATGGVLGGVLGSQVGKGSGKVAATIAGTLVGAFIGGAVGKSMDDVDRMKMNQALEQTRTGNTASWTNPDSNVRYNVTPTKTYYRGNEPCREYTTTAIIGGKREKVYGTACRTSDGNWRIVS